MANSLEILRLNYLGYTQRMIESTVHCSRHTVRQALDEAAEKNITWSLNDDITNEDLEKTRFPGKYKITNMYEQHKTRSCSTWVFSVQQLLLYSLSVRVSRLFQNAPAVHQIRIIHNKSVSCILSPGIVVFQHQVIAQLSSIFEF